MTTQWLLTVSPILALLVNVVIQITTIHLTFRIGLSIIFGILGGSLALICFLLKMHSSFSIMNACIGILTYLTLSFCFWAFLNLNITSLRIRVMRELLKDEDTGLSTETLLQYYSPQELIKRRIRRLEESGQIIKKEEKWTLRSRKLLVFVFVSTLLRKLIIPSKMRCEFN